MLSLLHCPGEFYGPTGYDINTGIQFYCVYSQPRSMTMDPVQSRLFFAQKHSYQIPYLGFCAKIINLFKFNNLKVVLFFKFPLKGTVFDEFVPLKGTNSSEIVSFEGTNAGFIGGRGEKRRKQPGLLSLKCG